jgi:hypothetical protein
VNLLFGLKKAQGKTVTDNYEYLEAAQDSGRLPQSELMSARHSTKQSALDETMHKRYLDSTLN